VTTLVGNITAGQRNIKVATPASAAVGLRFRIDDELCEIAGFDTHTDKLTRGQARWTDRLYWIINRGLGDSVPASHTSGATLTGALPASVSGDDLDPPDPFADAGGGGGGGGFDYTQDTDPGAIGAGQTWLRTDATETVDNLQLFVRNDSDDGWLPIGAADTFVADQYTPSIGVFDADTARTLGEAFVDTRGAVVLRSHNYLSPFATLNLQSDVAGETGLLFGQDVTVAAFKTGTADPSTGLAHGYPTLYLRDGGGKVIELWFTTGAGDNDWTLIGQQAASWSRPPRPPRTSATHSLRLA
jgi:hypothetical protein